MTAGNEEHRSRLVGPVRATSAAVSGVIEAALAVHAIGSRARRNTHLL